MAKVTKSRKVRCLCGCQQLTGGRFRPGHDARYASLLVQEYREADLSWEQVKQAADRVSPKFAAKVLARVARTNVINARRPE